MGKSISAKHQKQVFSVFFREEKSYTNNFEGTSMESALVKRFTDLNQTEIIYENSTNIGAEFKIKFRGLNDRRE
jgi:K+-sensing histidine kinase KdpD